MTTIEQLKAEINLKNKALTESLSAQRLLSETLKNNTRTLGTIEAKLKAIEINLTHANDCVYSLKQENMKLKLSCGEWMNRAINLQIKALSTRNFTNNWKFR